MYFEVELDGKKGLAKVNFVKGIIMRILNYDFYTYIPKKKIKFY